MDNRPKFCKDEHLEYLDDLRESGIVNMFGARPYLMKEYPTLRGFEAAEILTYWITSFYLGERADGKDEK